MKSKLIALVAAGLVWLASGVTCLNGEATAVSPKADEDFQLVKVAEGVYAAIAKSGGLASGNAGFVIGDRDVLIFDTFLTPAAIEELISEIQSLTRLPIKYAVNSHYAMMSIKLTNPTKTFSSGTLRLKLGKREVILATLPGHTGGDVFAYVPDANVVFTGDLGWSKTLPNLVDATVNEWIPTLDKILNQYPTAKFVPGHGNVAEAAEIRDFRDYLDNLRTRVKQGIATGLTIDQAKQQLGLPDKYKSFAFQNFATPNVEDMYKELAGTKGK